MNKILGILFILIVCITTSSAFAIYGNYDEFVQDVLPEQNQPLIIPKGSFFRGLMAESISSEFNNNGDMPKIYINSDFVLNDKIIIPKNSLFIGYVRDLNKAQQGMNGYFSIDIIGLVFPDGRQFAAKGYLVSSKNNKVFGGEFSKRIGHKQTLYRPSSFTKYGATELLQYGPRIMGKETLLKAGDLVNIVLEEPINVSSY